VTGHHPWPQCDGDGDPGPWGHQTNVHPHCASLTAETHKHHHTEEGVKGAEHIHAKQNPAQTGSEEAVSYINRLGNGGQEADVAGQG